MPVVKSAGHASELRAPRAPHHAGGGLRPPDGAAGLTWPGSIITSPISLGGFGPLAISNESNDPYPGRIKWAYNGRPEWYEGCSVPFSVSTTFTRAVTWDQEITHHARNNGFREH